MQVRPDPSPSAGSIRPAEPGSPLIVASVGTYSGPAGTILVPMVQGVQLWVQSTNDRGGLYGHQVKLIVYDDSGDPARHRAQVQEAVEQKHAQAFLMNGEVLTGQGSVEYVNAKRVPVIGLTGGELWAYSSPMYFPQITSAGYLHRTFVPSIARQMLPKGKRAVGSIICVEAQPACDMADRTFATMAEAAGLKHVYRARGSLVQPDYTAVCLAARNAGAEVLFMVLTQTGVRRVAADCARQGYRPVMAFFGQAVDSQMPADPFLEGAIASTVSFPHFASGSPATDEFQEAVARYGRNLILGSGVTIGWTAGKLLGRAGVHLAEPPTKEALLAGLWSTHEDDLGGLTYPLTFVQDQPAQPVVCAWDIAVRNGRWITPDGFQQHCEPAAAS